MTRRPSGIEWGSTLDAATGEALGEDLKGYKSAVGANEIDFGPHLAAIAERGQTRRYIQIHSHPESTALSDQDVALLIANDPLQMIVVAGVNGTWGVMAITDQVASARTFEAGRAARRAYQAIYLSLMPAITEQGFREGWDAPEARRIVTHRTSEIIAPQLGLRYHRVALKGG